MVNEVILNSLSFELKDKIYKYKNTIFKDLEEIRLRVNKPVIFKKKEEYFLGKSGLSKSHINSYICTKKDICQTIDIMSKRSYYAVEEDIKKGFLTLEGGHRVGISGKVIIEDGTVKRIKDILSINIRIGKEIAGCSKTIVPYIFNNNSKVGHTLLVSPPGCGKTTLLRDLIKNISNRGMTVSVVDERSELSGSHNGEMQIDLGIRTDVLENCPKDLGMMMLLRSMSPDVIAIDEIGSERDIKSIDMLLNAGVTILATIHSKDIEELKRKKLMSKLIEEKIFQNYIILSKTDRIGKIEGIYDRNFKKVGGD